MFISSPRVLTSPSEWIDPNCSDLVFEILATYGSPEDYQVSSTILSGIYDRVEQNFFNLIPNVRIYMMFLSTCIASLRSSLSNEAIKILIFMFEVRDHSIEASEYFDKKSHCVDFIVLLLKTASQQSGQFLATRAQKLLKHCVSQDQFVFGQHLSEHLFGLDKMMLESKNKATRCVYSNMLLSAVQSWTLIPVAWKSTSILTNVFVCLMTLSEDALTSTRNDAKTTAGILLGLTSSKQTAAVTSQNVKVSQFVQKIIKMKETQAAIAVGAAPKASPKKGVFGIPKITPVKNTPLSGKKCVPVFGKSPKKQVPSRTDSGLRRSPPSSSKKVIASAVKAAVVGDSASKKSAVKKVSAVEDAPKRLGTPVMSSPKKITPNKVTPKKITPTKSSPKQSISPVAVSPVMMTPVKSKSTVKKMKKLVASPVSVSPAASISSGSSHGSSSDKENQQGALDKVNDQVVNESAGVDDGEQEKKWTPKVTYSKVFLEKRQQQIEKEKEDNAKSPEKSFSPDNVLKEAFQNFPDILESNSQIIEIGEQNCLDPSIIVDLIEERNAINAILKKIATGRQHRTP